MYLNTNMIEWNKQKKWIDFGITTYCNAACPSCPRTDEDVQQAWPWLKPTHVNAKELVKVFERNDYFPGVEYIRFCGERGDPMMHPDIEYLIDAVCSHRKVGINTNGSLRNPDFYKRIAEKHGPNCNIIFSIDGFADTNHIYRMGLDFDAIWNNFTTFCKADGWADWDFLVWSHNWHQIPRVKKEAKELGIEEVGFKIVSLGNSYCTPIGKDIKKAVEKMIEY